MVRIMIYKHYRKCNYELWSVAKPILGDQTKITFREYQKYYRLYNVIIPTLSEAEKLGFAEEDVTIGECLERATCYLNGKQIAEDNEEMWKAYSRNSRFDGKIPTYDDFFVQISEVGNYGYLVDEPGLRNNDKYMLYYIGD